VPASARGNRVAVIVLGRSANREPFDVDNLDDVTDLAARTGIVIDNLRRQAREHSNSIALQNALLTTPPTGPGFTIVTRYLPATNDNEIGGDWYDALLQPDGTLLLAIGDVLGHDIHAAAAMGQLRGIIRKLAYTTGGTPADILTQADATARGLAVNVLATAVIGRIQTGAPGVASLQWSNAGHPPPLLITASGVQVLAGPTGRLLGLPPALHTPRHDHRQDLRPGDTLFFYTNGLVERSNENIDESIATLADALAGAAGRDLDEVCELAITSRGADMRDDVAILAVRIAAAEA
jgi:serine phosphatase RsbU (regulator of sigma subunit)